jgi:hypothetical protein
MERSVATCRLRRFVETRFPAWAETRLCDRVGRAPLLRVFSSYPSPNSSLPKYTSMGSYSFKIRLLSFSFSPHLRSRYDYNFGQAKPGHSKSESPSESSFISIHNTTTSFILAAVTGVYP